MKSVLLLTAVIGVTLAQYRPPSPPGYGSSPQGYRPSPPPRSYGTAPSYSGSAPIASPVPLPYGRAPAPGRAPGSNRRGMSDRISEGLEFVAEQVEVLETSDEAQTRRVDVLVESARDNFDLANDFEAYLYNEITREQEQQDYRLHALEARLNEIRQLRDQVNRLNGEADELRHTVENEAREERKQVMYEINQFQNADIALRVRISETQVRAVTINAQIDEIFETAANQTVSLNILEINVRRTIDSNNRQLSAFLIQPTRISPNGFDHLRPDVRIDFQIPMISSPQGYLASIVGFRIRRGHSYEDDYPSIYFQITQEISFDRINIGVVDMSSGGYAVDVVYVDFEAGYQEQTEFPKSFLDGV